jgi:hypothetical protein
MEEQLKPRLAPKMAQSRSVRAVPKLCLRLLNSSL